MPRFVSMLVDPVARVVREIDAALVTGSISNARSAVRESSRRKALQQAGAGSPALASPPRREAV